jgi:hypothetical protein
MAVPGHTRDQPMNPACLLTHLPRKPSGANPTDGIRNDAATGHPRLRPSNRSGEWRPLIIKGSGNDPVLVGEHPGDGLSQRTVLMVATSAPPGPARNLPKGTLEQEREPRG